MTKIKFFFSSNWVGCETKEILDLVFLGYTQEEWDALSEQEKEKELEDFAQDWASNYYEFGAYEVKDDEEDD